jgi:hypothetical protein
MSTARRNENIPDVDHDAETPVNPVRFSDSGRQFIIDECVICGETHAHGSMDPAVAEGERSHRVEHCHNGHDGGYYLELAEDAEPPTWWTGWIERERGVSLDR